MESKPVSFIKNIDQQLLKNNPVTWSTRIFPAIIYGLGFSLLLTLVSFIVPIDPRNETIIHYWIILVSIVSLLAFVFWMIYLLRFNVFKRFGKWSNADTIKTFLCYFFVTLIIISWPFIPPAVESVRADAAYTGKEIVKDINDMNGKLCLLERDSIDRNFTSDTFEIKRNIKGRIPKTITRTVEVFSQETPAVTDTVFTENIETASENYYFVDTAVMQSKLAVADSVSQLNDSVFIIYECPDYRFVYDWGIDEPVKKEIMSSIDLYRKFLQYRQVVDKDKIRTELGNLFTKYSRYHNPVTLNAGSKDYNYYDDVNFMSKIRSRYDLYRINSGIGNITEKKYRWDSSTVNASWRAAYYITLILALLVLIYRHSTRRTYFLSLLASVILFILTGLFVALSPYNSETFFIWPIIYFVVFLAITAFIFNSRYRSPVTGIGLNLLVFMTPFMPLLITGYYYSMLRREYYDKSEWESYAIYFKNEGYHYFLSEIGGFLLLILLLATFYHKAFRKWYSMPDQ